MRHHKLLYEMNVCVCVCVCVYVCMCVSVHTWALTEGLDVLHLSLRPRVFHYLKAESHTHLVQSSAEISHRREMLVSVQNIVSTK